MGRLLTVLVVAIFLFGCSDPDEKANALFVEAKSIFLSAEQDPVMARKLTRLQAAREMLQKIIDDHPTSEIGIILKSGGNKDKLSMQLISNLINQSENAFGNNSLSQKQLEIEGGKRTLSADTASVLDRSLAQTSIGNHKTSQWKKWNIHIHDLNIFLVEAQIQGLEVFAKTSNVKTWIVEDSRLRNHVSERFYVPEGSCRSRGCYFRLLRPIELNVTVTGIRSVDGSVKVVEFDWRQIGIPEILRRFTTQGGHGTAQFRLYDNGWRLNNISFTNSRTRFRISEKEKKAVTADIEREHKRLITLQKRISEKSDISGTSRRFNLKSKYSDDVLGTADVYQNAVSFFDFTANAKNRRIPTLVLPYYFIKSIDSSNSWIRFSLHCKHPFVGKVYFFSMRHTLMKDFVDTVQRGLSVWRKQNSALFPPRSYRSFNQTSCNAEEVRYAYASVRKATANKSANGNHYSLPWKARASVLKAFDRSVIKQAITARGRNSTWFQAKQGFECLADQRKPNLISKLKLEQSGGQWVVWSGLDYNYTFDIYWHHALDGSCSAGFNQLNNEGVFAKSKKSNVKTTAPEQNSLLGNPGSKWHGTVWQSGSSPYLVRVSVASGKIEVAYPSLKCGGEWVPNPSSRTSSLYVERIQFGKNKCRNNCKVNVSGSSNNQLQVKYVCGGNNPIVATATLEGKN